MMGCSTSRIDHLPAVSLCHDRCKFLDEALHQSYAFADAHVAYLQSLKSIGISLRCLVDQNLENVSDFSSTAEKTNPLKSPSSSSSPSPEHDSKSDSHLDFPADSDSDSENESKEFGERDFDLLHSIRNPDPGDDNKYGYIVNGGIFQAGLTQAWKTPPPPPPPPIGSHWEFLNFFDAYERYDLPPVKEEIHELKKETCDETRQKGELRRDSEKLEEAQEKKQSKNVEKTEKKQRKTEEKKNLSSLELLKEIEDQFKRAAASGNEVLKILDTGKFRYYDKNSIYQSVSSKMLQVVSSNFLGKPSRNSDVLEEKIASVCNDEEVNVDEVNFSSILKKLYMWEKKLYDEVKAEEKLRIVLARSYRQIENMAEKDIDEKKVDSARALIRTLSTKIRVSIHVIHKTSITINKLRDEQLWPFITQLIHKQLGMWKAMLESHNCQFGALVEAKNLDSILSSEKFQESHMESAIQLKFEIQKWNLNFSSWIIAQRCYVKALNGWLLKCLPYEPEEELPDKTRPPPLIFAFCNQWSQTVGRVSEIEVISAMNGLFMIVDQLVQRHHIYLQQRLSLDKELEKRMRILERKEKMMQRVIQTREKMLSGGGIMGRSVHQSEVIQNSSLEFGLKQIFKALEKFSVNYAHFYNELYAASSRSN